MPMYWGDYLRDTRDLTTLQHGAYMLLIAHYWQHERLPTDERQLAAITGLTRANWRIIQAPIAAKFQDGWRHKRIDEELERMERKINQRVIAGQKGGLRSGVARAVRRGQQIKDGETKRALPSRSSESEATGQAGAQHSRTNHQEERIETSLDATREGGLRKLGPSPELAEAVRKWGGQ